MDFAFDCIGATVTVQQTLAATKYGVWGGARGGTAVLVGLPVEPVALEMGQVLFGQRTYLGSVGGSSVPDRDFPLFLRVVPRRPSGPHGPRDAALSVGGNQRGVRGTRPRRNPGAGHYRAVGKGM